MSIPHDIFSRVYDTDERKFQRNLSAYAIVDLGVLEEVKRTERGVYGVIRSSRSGVDGSVVRYANVELLNIGSSMGGFAVGGEGEDLYLVFCPASLMSSTVTRETSPYKQDAYSSAAMKAIPVASMITWLSKAGFDRQGNFFIEFPDSTLVFNVDSSISYQHQNILKLIKNRDGTACVDFFVGSLQIFLDATGAWYKCCWDAGFLREFYSYNPNGTFTRKLWSVTKPSDMDKRNIAAFNNFRYIEIMGPDGVVQKTYRNAAGQTIASENISTAGKYTLMGTGVDINGGMGKLKLSTNMFNYSTWLKDVINVVKTLVINPGTFSPNPASVAALEALAAQLTLGTE